MSLPREELLKKLNTISDLYDNVLEIKEKMSDYTPDDNYERKIEVPRFPGKFHGEEFRIAFRDRLDHTASDALELAAYCYDEMYQPKKPSEPQKPQFNAPSTYDSETSQKNIGCASYLAIGVSIFFLIGSFVGVNESTADTLPIIYTVAAIAAALFIILRIIIMCKKAAAKKLVAAARAEHDKKIKNINAEYNNALKAYESKCEAYKLQRKEFLNEYIEWRKVYLKSVDEEKEIADKLEEERLEAVEKINQEELIPALNKLNGDNDLISEKYLPAINVITDLIKGNRADDVKEAINLYEDILYRERQLQLEREKEQQRRREEELRREDEERRYREEMEFREKQEYNRQLEAEEQRKAEERRHQEDMEQRERMERDRRYEEDRQREADRRSAEKADYERRRKEDDATRRQCNTCALSERCSVAFTRPNCASYRPR